MACRVFFLLLVLSLVQKLPPGVAAPVTPPEKHLGYPVGADFKLPDWNAVMGYFTRLDRESPRVITRKIGTTTEGRDFLMSIVSSEENLDRLDRIKACAAILADPRGHSTAEKEAAIREGRPIVFIHCAMHATEAAAPQFAMEFAYKLATSDEEPWIGAREKTVVVIFPSANPDGLDQVAQWYHQNVGTPFEAAGLVELYQRYTGHDNNRDWFMLTQSETRLVTEQLYRVWFPQVFWDIHQQGTGRERMFIPPYRDPLNPNIDSVMVTTTHALGGRAMLDMCREGLQGVSTGNAYDLWWNGSTLNVARRHNMIGLLTEAASVHIASPIFFNQADLKSPVGEGEYRPSNFFPSPWPGGWWRMRNIIDYEEAFGRSLLGSLSRESDYWLRACLGAAERAIAAGETSVPSAWLIPSDNRDPAAVRRLAEVLVLSGVELHVSSAPLKADGRDYPAGTIVIRRAQPYGEFVKDLFEIQRYPEGFSAYDVTGWTIPLLLGVRRVEVVEPIEARLRRVPDASDAVKAFAGDSRVGNTGSLLTSSDSGSWSRLVGHLGNGGTARLLTGKGREGLIELASKAADHGKKGAKVAKPKPSEDATGVSSLPRIGIYAAWTPHAPEGWMRYVFDTWKIPYVTVRNEMLRAGQIRDFLDVLILPGQSPAALDEGRKAGTLPEPYAGGLAPEGAVAVEQFVLDGGTLVATDASANWVIDLLELPLIDVTRGADAKDFFCAGSVLRGVAATDRPLAAGLPDSMPLVFSRSAAWRKMTDDERKKADREAREVETLLRYAPTRLLLSGGIKKPELIEGRDAWLRAAYGKGRVHLFGFQPHYRAWSQVTFPLLFRAVLLDHDRPEAAADAKAE